MPDYAGAEAAIRARLVANWTTTPITYQNEQPSPPWPPVDANGVLLPWVNLEIECTGAPIIGGGVPGNHVYRYEGTIMAHAFVPVGTGDALAKQYALSIGEIFRRKTFYDATPGYCVRTEDPAPLGGTSKSDDGNWFGVTMAVDFVYWHRG